MFAILSTRRTDAGGFQKDGSTGLFNLLQNIMQLMLSMFRIATVK
jgi:hypothetical protein